MNKTFREDPRGAQCRNEALGAPSSSDEEPKSKKVGLLAGGDSRRIANSDPYPCRHSFFLDQLSSVFFIPLLACATLSRNRLTQHKAKQLAVYPSELHLRVAMPPKKAEGFQNGKGNIPWFHEASILRIAITPVTNTRRWLANITLWSGNRVRVKSITKRCLPAVHLSSQLHLPSSPEHTSYSQLPIYTCCYTIHHELLGLRTITSPI